VCPNLSSSYRQTEHLFHLDLNSRAITCLSLGPVNVCQVAVKQLSVLFSHRLYMTITHFLALTVVCLYAQCIVSIIIPSGVIWIAVIIVDSIYFNVHSQVAFDHPSPVTTESERQQQKCPCVRAMKVS